MNDRTETRKRRCEKPNPNLHDRRLEMDEEHGCKVKSRTPNGNDTIETNSASGTPLGAGFGFRKETCKYRCKESKCNQQQTYRKLCFSQTLTCSQQPGCTVNKTQALATSIFENTRKIRNNNLTTEISNCQENGVRTDSDMTEGIDSVISVNKISYPKNQVEDIQPDLNSTLIENVSDVRIKATANTLKNKVNEEQRDSDIELKETNIDIDEPDFTCTAITKRRNSDDNYVDFFQCSEETINDKLFLSKTYPPSKKRSRITNDFDLEMDTIIPNDVHNKHMLKAPRGVPGQYENMDPKNQPLPGTDSFLKRMGLIPDKEPEQISNVYIPHKYADQPIGDVFGTQIWTYIIRQDDGTVYHQHFFVGVLEDAPAYKMKIRDNDEIVLVNGEFVPQISHTDLLNIFHKVPVDGKTRLKLIVRRVETHSTRSRRQWDWIETSAILAPDVKQVLDNYPVIEDLKFRSEKGDAIEIEPCIKEYNVLGTQAYLEITDGAVTAGVFTGTDADKSKRILKRSCYKIDPSSDIYVKYWAALCTEDRSRYISVGQRNEITLGDQPFWYLYQKEAYDHIWFKANDVYMSCNRETLKLGADTNKFLFREISPKESGFDWPDGFVSQLHSQSNYTLPSDSQISPVKPIPGYSVAAADCTPHHTCEDQPNTGKEDILRTNCGYSGQNSNGANGTTNQRTSEYCTDETHAEMDTGMTLNIPTSLASFPTSPCDRLITPTSPFAKILLS